MKSPMKLLMQFCLSRGRKSLQTPISGRRELSATRYLPQLRALVIILLDLSNKRMHLANTNWRKGLHLLAKALNLYYYRPHRQLILELRWKAYPQEDRRDLTVQNRTSSPGASAICFNHQWDLENPQDQAHRRGLEEGTPAESRARRMTATAQAGESPHIVNQTQW